MLYLPQALKQAGATSTCDVHILSTTGTARPVPQMDVIVDHFLHVPWPPWYRQYVLQATGEPLHAAPGVWLVSSTHNGHIITQRRRGTWSTDGRNRREGWVRLQYWSTNHGVNHVCCNGNNEYMVRFAYDAEGWEGERPMWEDDSFFTNLMGEFGTRSTCVWTCPSTCPPAESSAAKLLAEQPSLKVSLRTTEVEEGDEWLSGDCFTVMVTTRYGVDPLQGKVDFHASLYPCCMFIPVENLQVHEVQSVWNMASGFTGQLEDILDVYLMTTGMHRWRFDHHDALTVLPTYADQQPSMHTRDRWYRRCKGRRMLVQRDGVVVQPGRSEGWGGFTRPGGHHVLMGPVAIDFLKDFNATVQELDAQDEANWDPDID